MMIALVVAGFTAGFVLGTALQLAATYVEEEKNQADRNKP